MLHLKMCHPSSVPARELQLPEGLSVTRYSKPEDERDWIECCKNGLVADDAAGKERFERDVVGRADVNFPNDVLFLDLNGEHIATATLTRNPEKNSGGLHMVGMKSEYRGRGFIKYLNNAAVKILIADGVDYIDLLTSEWRVNAIRSYLSEGFLPVEYADGMEERWQTVLRELKIESVDMVFENGSFYKKIHI